jgi:GNAT superfamily N-acetyltransferase
MDEAPRIWEILQQAIDRRKADGSRQWQDGYPNGDVVRSDIEKGVGYVLTDGKTITGYCAVLINDEPAYAEIEGKWLTEGDFVVVHRVAVADECLGTGMAIRLFGLIGDFALGHGIGSIKADTNFDNAPMLHIFDKLGFVYCGKVFFRGSARNAFEKVLY